MESEMSKRIGILVIDDDPELQELVEYNLRLNGFEVYQALNGKQGLKLAAKKQPQVILLDRTMPDMDGLEVLSELKYNDKTAHIPVFMLTAKTMLGDIDRAFDLGADDYITKPVRLMQLGNTVKAKLRKLKPSE